MQQLQDKDIQTQFDQGFSQELFMKSIQMYENFIKLNPQLSKDYNNKGLKVSLIQEFLYIIWETMRNLFRCMIKPQNLIQILMRFTLIKVQNYLKFLGVSFYKLKREEEATQMFDNAIQLNPDSYLAQSSKEYSLKNQKLKEESIEKDLIIGPTHQQKCEEPSHEIPIQFPYGSYDHYISDTLRKQNRNEEAIQMYDLAIKLSPQFSEAYNNKGECLHQLKKYVEAIEMYDQAIKYNPESSQAYNHKGKNFSCNLGVSLKYLKQYKESIQMLNQAIKLNPQFSEAYYNKGGCLYQLQYYYEAVEMYDQAIRFNPLFSEAYMNKGFSLHQFCQYEEAVKMYDQAIKLNYKLEQGSFDNGTQIKLYEEAINMYDQALHMNSKYYRGFELSYKLGVSLSQLNRNEEGNQFYDGAIKQNPQFSEAHRTSKQELNIIEKAIQIFDKAIQFNPESYLAYTIKSLKQFFNLDVLFNQFKRNDKSIQIVDMAILNPQGSDTFKKRCLQLFHILDDFLCLLIRNKEAIQMTNLAYAYNACYPEAYNNKADCLCEMDRNEEAIQNYDIAINLNPQFAQAYNNKGDCLHKLKYYEQAVRMYDQAIKLNPRYEQAYNNKGLSLHHLKQYEEAIHMYDQALQLKPQYFEAYNNKGLSLSKLNRNEEAIQNYDIAIKQNPLFCDSYINKGSDNFIIQVPPLQNQINLKRQFRCLIKPYNLIKSLMWLILIKVQIILQFQLLNEEAIQMYDNAIQLNPQDSDSYMNKGDTLRLLKRNEEAIQMYDKAIELHPLSVQAYNNKGDSLCQLNRNEEAIQNYDIAIEWRPQFAQAYNNKGACLHQQKQYEEAVKMFDQAIKLNPKFYEAYFNKGYVSYYKGNSLVSLNQLDEAKAMFEMSAKIQNSQ
ncbi:hypothetical protein pb186bvf_017504 [Paramecium bursaria]